MQPARTRPAPDRTRFSPEKALFLAAAVILVLGSQMPLASYLSPKNGLGYVLGIVGGVMLLLQSLYAIRKRMPSLAFSMASRMNSSLFMAPSVEVCAFAD